MFEKLAAKDNDNKKHKRFLDALNTKREDLWNYFLNFDKNESV